MSRERIMAVIGEGGRTFQIAKRCGVSTTKARYYLRTLEDAGRVTRDERYSSENDIYWRPAPPPPWFKPLMETFERVGYARNSRPTPAEKHKSAQFFHYEDWDHAQEHGGTHGPRVTADLAQLLHDHTAPLRAALSEAHDVMHECTAVLSATDCARVAAVMGKVRQALRDSDRNPEGHDAQRHGAEHESAGPQDIAPPPPDQSPNTRNS